MSEQRLIDANAFIAKLEERRIVVSPDGAPVLIDLERFYGLINEQQTIDPVRRGGWLNDSGYDDWYCSECGFEINCDEDYPTKYDNFKYCGRCGAKMDKE